MRTKSLWLMAALAVFTLSACGGAPPAPMQGTADDEATLRGMADRYAAAFSANDAAGLAALVADNYEVVDPNGTHVTGRAAFQQMFEAGSKARPEAGQNPTLSTTTDFLNWIDASHAVMGGTYTVAGVPAGAPTSGSWLVVAVKSASGEWQLMSSLGAAFIAPPGGSN